MGGGGGGGKRFGGWGVVQGEGEIFSRRNMTCVKVKIDRWVGR